MTHDSTRRRFLSGTMAFGAAAALSRYAPASAFEDAKRDASAKQLKLLILGGTGFLGPACIEAAQARGHAVTIFNRGKREDGRKRAGRPSVIPEGVEVLYGNRDPEKTADSDDNEAAGETKVPGSPKGLSQLEGRKWDVVIDTSAYFPRIAKASAELLAPNVEQYLFISTLSVYGSPREPGLDETAETVTLADPKTEEFGASFENYGGGKALCEQAIEAAMPGRATIVRPGYIVGPRDTSARFLFWPVRVKRGGTMLVPGGPDDPLQIIDVNDLAEWCVRLLERKTTGVFNATGPDKPLSMKAMLEGCRSGLGVDTKFTWVDPKFLAEHKVTPEEAFPLWSAADSEGAAFHRCNPKKAVDAGLTFRPVAETAKTTMAWYDALGEGLQKKVVRVVVDEAKERELLTAWAMEQAK